MTDLANLRELLEKATKGDWAVHPLFARIVTAEHVGRPIGGSEDLATDFATYAQEICALHHPDRHRPESETLANANLIAALRNEAPALLDEVEKLRAALRDSDCQDGGNVGKCVDHGVCTCPMRELLGGSK